ncbi:hypothetical protein [Streptomyces sp. SM12]|uniref:hypothetical protein n=1 Tax=Streptomyces sp. SM12 TaxID=1071602 RepID=UPI000CD4DC6D|nr:hypothetical protein [Streptomyces sp. SM12]
MTTDTTVTDAAVSALLSDQEEVRGLTVRQPWASAIAHLDKRTENRSRITTYTGTVLIHAGKTPDAEALRDAPADLPGIRTRGAVLAVARLTGCHRPTAAHCDKACERWGDPDRVHWRLADVVPLRTPVPARGALYLWTPTAPLRQQIAAALHHAHA